MARTRSSARILLCLTTAVAALTAQPALAQVDPATTAADEAAVDGDIVVTARRREESLQDVPIAVTAYSGEALETQGALDITDLGDTTPNVTLEASRATNSTLSAFIRGVGQQDPVAGFEQGVGIYLDDVYLNRPQAAVLDIYDVERIEILRGPQGTLYGRNTIGGAVKYVTRRLADDPTLRLRANLGTDEQADLIASASTPVGSGVLRFGGAVARLSRGGFGTNLTTDEENYNKDVWAGRLSAEVNNKDNIFFRLSADYTKDKSNPRGGHRLIPSLISNAPVLNDVFDTRGGLADPKQIVESYGISLFGEVELNDMFTVRSISAWRKDDSSTPIDFDALPAVDVDVPGRYNNEQFSQELQALIEVGPLNGLIGGYFLDADAATPFDVRLFTTLAGLTGFTDAAVHTETFAVFGDFTYDLTDQFSISAGGRYTWDKREATILRQNYLGGGSPEFGGAGVPFGAPGTDFSGKRSFNKFTPRVSVSFKPTSDHNLYASYSQGFKGGGFDPRGAGANAPDLNGDRIRSDDEIADFLSFEPEKVDSYEIGYKGSLFDRRLNIALAGFLADYTNVQIPGSEACTIGGLPSFCGNVTNAGKAKFKGIEFEANARLAQDMATAGDTLRLSGTLGYIDAQFKEYVTNVANFNADGSPAPGTAGRPVDIAPFRDVQNTPKWTLSSTLNYSVPVGGGDLAAVTTVSYRSKTTQFETPSPFLDQPGYALWDASLVWRSSDDRYSIGVHAKNITDKHYITSGYQFLNVNPVTGAPVLSVTPFLANGSANPTFARPGISSALGREGVLTAFYGNPRQIFVSFGVNF